MITAGMGRKHFEAHEYSQSQSLLMEDASWEDPYFWLTIGPDRECSFCGLEHEIDEHLLWRFQKSKLRWSVIGSFVGMDLEEINHFTGGEWLTRSWQTRCGKSSSRLLWP